MKAEIREEIVTIPTYKIAKPEKSPLFIEKRAYQGSTGKVYPFPVTEKIYDNKELKEYKAIILETGCWEKVVSLKPDFAMAYRNLSIAYYNKEKDTQKALNAIRKACQS